MTPPAEGLAARFVLGPALRAQPDRRLVALVRDGYETAFEEIVHRYGAPLRRHAARIVGERAEDVTQDALSKALVALRRNGAEIELRPWLFRIVRNTALNDLRDNPPPAEELAEALVAGGRSAAEEIERREELAELIRGLRALPEAQRVAILMRELEGLGHAEIAAALGVSGSGARQAIYRARIALRDGLGMLLPLPLLRAVMDTGVTHVEAAPAGAAGLGGAGVVLKAATATVLVAGAVGAGVAVDHGRHNGGPIQANVAEGSNAGAPVVRPSSPPATSESGEADESGGRFDREPARGKDDRGSSGSGRSGGSVERDDERGARDGLPAGQVEGDKGREPEHGGGDGASGSPDQGGGDGRSGPGDGSSGSGEGSSGEGGSSGENGESSGSSGPGDGPSQSTSEGTGAIAESNSGPGSSGGGGEDGATSGSSGDSHGGDGFSMQTEPQSQEAP